MASRNVHGAIVSCVTMVVLLSSIAGLSARARAQDGVRVAVAPFGGRGAGALQRAVERVLGERAQLVSPREVDEAAQEAGVSGTASDGVVALASALGADVIVQGAVSGTRRRPQLELVLRAADGAELARAQLTVRGRAGRRALADEIGSLFDRASAALAARAPEPMPDPPDPVEEAPADEGAPDDGLAILSATLGVALRNRDAEIQLSAARPRSYVSGPYPEIAIALELRPFAADSHLGRGLFLTGGFGHSIGLGSETQGTGTAVSTSFVRFAFGAGWLAPIGDAAELGAGLSFAYDGYHLGPNVVMPTAEYLVLRPALRGRVRLAKETFVIDAEVAYRGVLGIGALASSFGESASAHGVDVGVSLGGNLVHAMGLGFTWAVRFDWVGYFLELSGPASDAPGTSGSESALRGTVLLGWSIR